MRTPIIKIKRSHDHLIFIMEIPIPGKMVFILRWGPDVQNQNNTFHWLYLTVNHHKSYHCKRQAVDEDIESIFTWLALCEVNHQSLVYSSYKWPRMWRFDIFLIISHIFERYHLYQCMTWLIQVGNWFTKCGFPNIGMGFLWSYW